MFTVTNIKNYVKVIDSESNLMIKTILKGSLSGFLGMYELEVPYNKGKLLNLGTSFKVKVQVGTYKDRVIIGDIEYR